MDTYNGKPVDDMTIEELKAAVITLGKLYNDLLNNLLIPDVKYRQTVRLLKGW